MADELLVSEAWLAAQCERLCSRAAGVRTADRRKFIRDEIKKLGISDGLRYAIENMMDVSEITAIDSMGQREKLAIGACSAVFLLLLLAIAIFFPYPSPFQYVVFRVTLALVAGGIGGILTGFLLVRFGAAENPWLKAGGGLAMCAVVYFLNPVSLAIAKCMRGASVHSLGFTFHRKGHRNHCRVTHYVLIYNHSERPGISDFVR